MHALILAAILSQPVSPICQQWLDRVEQESRYASRLVWSPRKERHIERTNRAAEMARVHCQLEPAESVASQSVQQPAAKRGL